jgi:hypothetical protein
MTRRVTGLLVPLPSVLAARQVYSPAVRRVTPCSTKLWSLKMTPAVTLWWISWPCNQTTFVASHSKCTWQTRCSVQRIFWRLHISSYRQKWLISVYKNTLEYRIVISVVLMSCAADFIALKNSSPWPGFEPVTFGSSGQHINHYTTKATTIKPKSRCFLSLYRTQENPVLAKLIRITKRRLAGLALFILLYCTDLRPQVVYWDFGINRFSLSHW